MATIGRKAYDQTATSALTTELNSLANANGSAASAAIDNSTTLSPLMDIELNVTYGTAPTAGSTVDVYLIPSLDATNYGDYTSGATPVAPKAYLVASFELRAVTTAQRVEMTGILIPQAFKLAVINNAGQAMAASGNTVKYRTYSYQSV